MLSRLWFSQFPEWARPEHPIMRSILGGIPESQRRRRLLLAGLVIVGLFAVAVYAYVTTDALVVRDLLYYPLVFAQVVAVIVGLTLTSNAVATEEQRGTWDTLKLTLVGVPLTLRARWIAVFHQLRWLLGAIIIGRIVYLGLLLSDITEFQGRALDLYISGISPEVSLDVAILIMVAFMTAFVMQPVVAVAVSAAIGVILSVTVRSRAMVFILMLLVIGIYLALVFVGVTFANEQILERTQSLTQQDFSDTQGWGSLMLMALAGDMGIKLTELETQGQIWADFEYGIYFGAIYLAVVVIAGSIANALVVISAKRAAKPTRT
ncbi:MAG: hypothetical protein L0154_22030 [Chloroflexi bacterium]|nr:hypothetical protein [Chloroflexota bacterium]